MSYLSMSDLQGLGAAGAYPACDPILAAADAAGVQARTNPSVFQSKEAQESFLRAAYEACLVGEQQKAVRAVPPPSMDCTIPQYNERYATGINPYKPGLQDAEWREWQCRAQRHVAAVNEKVSAAREAERQAQDAAKAREILAAAERDRQERSYAAARQASQTSPYVKPLPAPAAVSSSAPASVRQVSVARTAPASIAASQIASPRPVTEVSTQQAAMAHAQAAISRARPSLLSTSILGPLSITPFNAPDIQTERRSAVSTAVWVGAAVTALALFGWLALRR